MTPEQAANTIREMAARLLAQDRFEKPYVDAGLAALKVLEDAANDWESTARAESDGLMNMREQRDAAEARAEQAEAREQRWIEGYAPELRELEQERARAETLTQALQRIYWEASDRNAVEEIIMGVLTPRERVEWQRAAALAAATPNTLTEAGDA